MKSDYVAGELTAPEWRELRGELGEEHAAVAAQVLRRRTHEADIREQHAAVENDEALVEYLADVRAMVSGQIKAAAADPEPLRAALGRAFERFELRTVPEYLAGLRGERLRESGMEPGRVTAPGPGLFMERQQPVGDDKIKLTADQFLGTRTIIRAVLRDVPPQRLLPPQTYFASSR